MFVCEMSLYISPSYATLVSFLFTPILPYSNPICHNILIENVFNTCFICFLISDNTMVSNRAERMFSCSRTSPDMKMVY